MEEVVRAPAGSATFIGLLPAQPMACGISRLLLERFQGLGMELPGDLRLPRTTGHAQAACGR